MLLLSTQVNSVISKQQFTQVTNIVQNELALMRKQIDDLDPVGDFDAALAIAAQNFITTTTFNQWNAILGNEITSLHSQLDDEQSQIDTLNAQVNLIQASGIPVAAIYSVNGVANPGGDIELVAGSGIIITNDPTTKRITISLA
jgi:hypothetical protein